MPILYYFLYKTGELFVGPAIYKCNEIVSKFQRHKCVIASVVCSNAAYI